MRARLLAALALTLAACDDEPTVISHVDRRDGFRLEDLWRMQDARGIPVEIHGSPFHRISDAEITDALRPPGGSAQEVRFYAMPAGSWVRGKGARLVLHFNPQGAPNAPADCQRVEEARTNPAPEGRFTVNASFCAGPDWQAHGYLQALQIGERDLVAFGDMFGQLMLAIFREEPDR